MVVERNKQLLAAVRPHLVILIELLSQLEQATPENSCAPFEDEYDKDISDEMCSNRSFWGEEGARKCFECVFRHYGLVLPEFGGDIPTATQLARFRALLQAYLDADKRLLDIIRTMEDCELPAGANLDNLTSVLDLILGPDALQILYSPDASENALGGAQGTGLIVLPEGQFIGAEDRAVNPDEAFDYQTIGFLFIHELGHIFHNRLQEVFYVNEQGGTVELELRDGSQREVTLPADTPGAVRDYLEFVGGYYADQRDFNYPAQYAGYSQTLTSLNYYGPGQPLDIYDANGRILDSVRAQFQDAVTIQTDASGREYVYVDRNGGAVQGTPPIRFIEANTYIPDLADVQTRLNQLGEGRPGIQEFFPNERRDTTEPREGFADTFAAFILRPDILEGTKRGQFFDQNIKNWLCQLLQEVL